MLAPTRLSGVGTVPHTRPASVEMLKGSKRAVEGGEQGSLEAKVKVEGYKNEIYLDFVQVKQGGRDGDISFLGFRQMGESWGLS